MGENPKLTELKTSLENLTDKRGDFTKLTAVNQITTDIIDMNEKVNLLTMEHMTDDAPYVELLKIVNKIYVELLKIVNKINETATRHSIHDELSRELFNLNKKVNLLIMKHMTKDAPYVELLTTVNKINEKGARPPPIPFQQSTEYLKLSEIKNHANYIITKLSSIHGGKKKSKKSKKSKRRKSRKSRRRN